MEISILPLYLHDVENKGRCLSASSKGVHAVVDAVVDAIVACRRFAIFCLTRLIFTGKRVHYRCSREDPKDRDKTKMGVEDQKCVMCRWNINRRGELLNLNSLHHEL